MKNIKLITGIFLILTAFTFTSCEIEPIDSAIDLDDFENPTAGPVVFKADFSGSTWNATTAQAVVSDNFITIAASKADGSTFAILVNATATGTYPANDNIVAYTPATSEFAYWSMNMENPSEDTGSVTITSINTTNHTVSGTFQYRGYWSDMTVTSIIPVDFTNGVFTNIPYIPNTETGDTFFAKVDGVEFVDTLLTGAEVGSGVETWLNVAAVDGALNDITVAFKKSMGAGTYVITGGTSDNASCSFNSGSGIDYDGISGTLTITSLTTDRVKGTFSFVGSDGASTKTVSEGSFDVGY
ncbi:MAG: DUF6252 family protein [Bacteroidota bacterium]